MPNLHENILLHQKLLSLKSNLVFPLLYCNYSRDFSSYFYLAIFYQQAIKLLPASTVTKRYTSIQSIESILHIPVPQSWAQSTVDAARSCQLLCNEKRSGSLKEEWERNLLTYFPFYLYLMLRLLRSNLEYERMHVGYSQTLCHFI